MKLCLLPIFIHFFAFFIPFAHAVPFKRDADLASDTEILNFGLAMEYLLSAAYRDGLARYSNQDFESAGFGSFTPGRLLEIADHEDSHVEILKTAVSEAGGYPVPKCEYQFLYDGPASFIKTVFELEETMTSWYCASQAFIKRKEYSSVAAAILPTEARHSAWLNSAVRKQNAWSTSLETPLTEKHVFSVVSGYIFNCSASYPIQLEAFPKLVFSSNPVPGRVVQFQAASGSHDITGKPTWIAFLNGARIRYAMVHPNQLVTIPNGLKGTTYAVWTRDKRRLTDENTIAGPALVTFPFNSEEVLV